MTKKPSDKAVLDWAETHPEAAMRALTSWWAMAGQGAREVRFEFRNILREVMTRWDGDRHE